MTAATANQEACASPSHGDFRAAVVSPANFLKFFEARIRHAGAHPYRAREEEVR
jgi:hypothetical protein